MRKRPIIEDGWDALAAFMSFVAIALLLFILFGIPRLAWSQEHRHERPGHAQFHDTYQNWVNRDGKGCCNGQDCAPIAAGDERTTNGRLEVRIEGEWCPVLPKHYLKRGNVPNASVSHACVTSYYGGMTPCEKFICYQPQPGI